MTGAIGLPDGAEMIMPGDNVEMSVELITPIALEVGQRFAIREGGRTVGAGAIVTHHRVADDMARVEARPTIQLACTECKERTYTTRKNKKNDPNRIELHEILPALTDGIHCTARRSSRPHRRGVAQLAEHWSPKPAVVGSSPIAPATPRP